MECIELFRHDMASHGWDTASQGLDPTIAYMQDAFGKYCSEYSGAVCTKSMFQRGTRSNQPESDDDPYTFGVFVLCRWSGTKCTGNNSTESRTNFVAAPRLNPTQNVLNTVSDPSTSVWVDWDPVPRTRNKRSYFCLLSCLHFFDFAFLRILGGQEHKLLAETHLAYEGRARRYGS